MINWAPCWAFYLRKDSTPPPILGEEKYVPKATGPTPSPLPPK